MKRCSEWIGVGMNRWAEGCAEVSKTTPADAPRTDVVSDLEDVFEGGRRSAVI